MNTPEFNWDIIATAGLTQDDFANLIIPAVTRVTVNKWVTGKCQPSHLVIYQVEKWLNKIEEKVMSGTLPIELPDTREATRIARQAALLNALN